MMECKDPKPFYSIGGVSVVASAENAVTTTTVVATTESMAPISESVTACLTDTVASKAIIENGISDAKLLPKIEPNTEDNDEALSEADESNDNSINSINTIEEMINVKVESMIPDSATEYQHNNGDEMECVKPGLLVTNLDSHDSEVQNESVQDSQSEVLTNETPVPSESENQLITFQVIKRDVSSPITEEPESQVQKNVEANVNLNVVAESIVVNNKSNITSPKEKNDRTLVNIEKHNEKENINTKHVSPNAILSGKRTRYKTQVYQAPLPEEVALISKLTNSSQIKDDRVVVFQRNEFLAVRSPEENFFICRSMYNINKKSKKCRVQWLAEVKKNDNDTKDGDVYKLDFWDTIDFESILTNIKMKKIEKDKFLLPSKEKERIGNILKKALDLESGIKTPPSDNCDDGIDISQIVEVDIPRKQSYRLVDRAKSRTKKDKNVTKIVSPSKGKKRSQLEPTTIHEPPKKVRRSNRLAQETFNASMNVDDDEIMHEPVTKKKSTKKNTITTKVTKPVVEAKNNKVNEKRNTKTLTNTSNTKGKKNADMITATTTTTTARKRKTDATEKKTVAESKKVVDLTITATKNTRGGKRVTSSKAKVEKKVPATKTITTTKKTDVKKKTTSAVVVDGKVTKKRPKRTKY